MKKYAIVFLGDWNKVRINAVFKIVDQYPGFQGLESISCNGPDFETIVANRLKEYYDQDIEPIIMKGCNIHTEDYIRPIIKYYKNNHPKEKFFLTHCACFDDFILTDGALLTKYTKENIESVIKNAIELKNKLDKVYINYRLSDNIALLNAGGDTNPNTAPEGWMDIYNDLKNKYKLEMTQFDVATNASIRREKLNKYDSLDISSIIIPSSINEGNSIWKVLTTISKQSLAGIVVGIPMYIGLTSRTDTEESITKTLDYLLKMYTNKE